MGRHNTTNPTARRIAAKRATVSVPALKRRMEAGEDVSEQRALVRLGKGNTGILLGIEDLSLWTEEELARGQRLDKNGCWQGKRPAVVPRALHDELIRRTLSKSNLILIQACEKACEAVVEIMMGDYFEEKEDPKAKDRLAAAEVIMNRVMGKEPVRVMVESFKSQFEETFEAMIVPDDDAIDVDSWEDDDEADDDAHGD